MASNKGKNEGRGVRVYVGSNKVKNDVMLNKVEMRVGVDVATNKVKNEAENFTIFSSRRVIMLN